MSDLRAWTESNRQPSASKGDASESPESAYPWESRFWAKVDRSGGPSSCWTWTAYRGWHGYGMFRLGHRRSSPIRAHRAAFLLVHGRLPVDGLVLRHECDCKACVNPAHLLEGTQRENIADAIERGLMVPGARRGPDGRFTKAVRS